MKSIYYGTIASAMIMAAVAAGCGSSNNNQPTPVGAVTNGAIAAPGTYTIPVGCYTPGSSIQYGNVASGSCPSGAVPCPSGYTQNGSSCILASGSYGGVNCNPMGGTWSTTYTGCVTTTGCSYYSGYTCSPYQGGYGSVYYYTNGAPSYSGSYYGYGSGGYWAWNGYSWVWI